MRPLKEMPIGIKLEYTNAGDKQKAPMEKIVTALAGTPTMNFSLADGELDTFYPGQKRNFELNILFTKMKSDLRVEVFTLFFIPYHEPKIY